MVGRETKGNNQFKNKDKRRNAQAKKLCLRECSSLLINFAGKQKKNTPPYCYM